MMKMKRMKRWLSLLLALFTVLPILLTTATAETTDGDVTEAPEESSFDILPYSGMIKMASVPEVRMTTDGGIRFVSKVEVARYNELVTLTRGFDPIKELKIGTLIAPVSYITAAGDFSVEALDQLGHDVNYVKVEARAGYWYNGDDGADGYYEFAGSLSNIKLSHYTDAFAGIGYIELLLATGETKYIYGSYSRAGASINGLATALLAEPASLNSAQIEYLQAYELHPVEFTSSVMSDVYQVGNRLYFTVGETSAYLAYTGNNGWRIKAHHLDKLGAEGFGAAQALAYYIGEESADVELPITVSYPNDEEMRITAEDGTYVEIPNDSFGLNFYSVTDRPVANIRSITTDGTNSTITGAFNTTEAVYGGGEWLDTVNKRGTAMDMYTCDGWNNSATSYMVIPFFMTTRGAGLYVNRYERIKADFGTTDVNTWSFALENEIMDFYVFANDDMKDSLAGYTALTGSADVPEEWAYGVMLCRYSSDLTSFENPNAYSRVEDIPEYETLLASKNGENLVTWLGAGNVPENGRLIYGGSKGEDIKYIYLNNDEYPGGQYVKANKDGAPSGRSVKLLVEKMTAAGMKPTAVIMEAWNYTNISNMGSETAKANREEMRKTCELLDEQGIKAMVYMRVASTISSSMPGYSNDYLLKAWVTTNGETTYTTRIPDVAYNGQNPDAGEVGKTHAYVDITNPLAMEWYLDVVWGDLIELGVDGVKIDFCETFPDEYVSYGVGENTTTVKYDWYDRSKIVSGSEHHAYPTYFISAFYKRMNEIKEEMGMTDGFYVLSRGGGIGSQRNPYLWAGDQARNFDKLDDQILAVVNSGLSGVPFMSYDMAGYRYGGGGTSYANSDSLAYESEIFARAIAFTVFMPNVQTHGTVRNAYELTEEAQQIYKNFLALREELMPYLTKCVNTACETGLPVVRHPVLNYQSDTKVYNLTTQFMLGDGLMIAPALSRTDDSVKLYLPNGTWTNLLTGEQITGGRWLTVTSKMGTVPVFLNNASADAEMLHEIFASDAWKAIQAYQ